jgi:hypothetical protein
MLMQINDNMFMMQIRVIRLNIPCHGHAHTVSHISIASMIRTEGQLLHPCTQSGARKAC